MAAIELGIPYYIYQPDLNDYVAFNVPNDPNFVGYLSDVTGLDDSEVRENAQNINAGDGGYHGAFYKGRRPWTISGFIMPTTPLAARSAAVQHMESVLDQCLKADGYLQWVPSDGITKFLYFRKQQPFRDTKGQSNVQRTFAIAGVAANFRIQRSGPLSSIYGLALGSNKYVAVNTIAIGNADALPIFTIGGPITAPWSLENVATTKSFRFSTSLGPTDALVVDLTQTYPSILLNGSDASGSVDVINTDWTIAVAKGLNNWNMFEWGSSSISSSVTSLQIQWRDTWS